MEFEYLTSSAAGTAAIAAMSIAAVLAVVLILSLTNARKFVYAIFAILGIACIIAAVTSQVEDNKNRNNEALIANIEKKYDVDEVLLEYGDYVTKPNKLEKNHVSVRVDDKVYTFGLEQDDRTFEPTLKKPEKWHDNYDDYKTYPYKPMDLEKIYINEVTSGRAEAKS